MGGFNQSKQNQSSQSFSDSISNSQNTAFNNQDSGAQNWANQQAIQQAQSATTLYGGQAPFLQDLWSRAAGVNDPGIAAQARGAWGGALSGGINPGVADVIANASADMGLDFQRNVLPGIRRGSVGTGSLGGSRQGIAEGLAAGEVARAQQNMATQLYTGALDQASRERTAALSMSGQMQALPWQGLESYARTLGGPVMQSYGSSGGQSYGSSGGSSYGIGRAGSQGTSSGLASASGYGQGSGSAFGMNILGKGGG